MAAKPYMPFYTKDYMEDTSRLSTEEHGAYLLLIIDYWHTEKPLPDDLKKLSLIAKMAPKRFKKVFANLKLFFSKKEGHFYHKRIEQELKDYKEKALNRASQAKKAAETRWGSDAQSNAPSMPAALLTECSEQCSEQCGVIAISNTNTNTNTISNSNSNSKKEESKDFCAEPGKPPGSSLAKIDEPIFIFIPVLGGDEVGISERIVLEFVSSYPNVDVRQKLREMRAWSFSNPKKQKTKRGILRFVNGWLAKEQNNFKSGPSGYKLNAVEHNQLVLEGIIAEENQKKLRGEYVSD